MTEDSPNSASERRIERFVENLPGIAYRCRPGTPWEMEFVGGRVRATTGYSASAFESGAVAYGDIVHDDDVEALQREIRSAVESRSQFSATYRIRTRGGDVRHVFERGAPVIECDEVEALEGIIVDVTDRKESKRRLRRQNELFTNTQRLADVGGWELDVERGELQWTDQVKRIHGLPLSSSPSLEDALGFYHPEDRPEIRAAVESAIEDGEPFDRTLRLQTDHGEQRWVRVRGMPMSRDGDVVRVSGAIQDVTDSKQREQALREERMLTRSIFEALPNPLYAFDENGRFRRWNEELSDVTGYADEELEEMAVLELVAEQDRSRVEDYVEKVIEDDASAVLEARLRTKDGDLIPYEFTGAKLLGDDGTNLGLVGTGRDISERKKRERLLRMLHRLLRHNLRNDLNVIKGYTTTLEEEISEEALAEYADRIETAAVDLLAKSETAKELLDISLKKAEAKRPVDVGELLERIGEKLRHRHPDADIDMEVDGGAILEGDSRLETLFDQLLENAIEHSDCDVPRVEVAVTKREDEVCIEVADNGPGIPREEWSVVVEEGKTDTTQLRHGSGVGLLLAKWVVDDYGGHLEYEGESDDGAQVTVRLPAQ